MVEDIDKKLAYKLETQQEQDWTAMSDAMRSMGADDRKLLYDLANSSPDEFLKSINQNPHLVEVLKSFLKVSIVEVLKMHFEQKSLQKDIEQN